MADLAITAANVVAGVSAQRLTKTALEAITAGKAVTFDGDNVRLADSNSPTVALRHASGIALNGAAVNQPVTVQTEGEVSLGAVLTLGVAYYLSDTPGGLCPQADVGTGENVNLIGLAKSASVLSLSLRDLGVTA